MRFIQRWTMMITVPGILMQRHLFFWCFVGRIARSAPVLHKDQFPNGSVFLQHKFIFITYRLITVSKVVLFGAVKLLYIKFVLKKMNVYNNEI